jgi:hypothetical protein
MAHPFANDWLNLIAGERLTASTAVGVEHNDVLFLGEVVRSTSYGNDEWAIDIKVEHTLNRFAGLDASTGTVRTASNSQQGRASRKHRYYVKFWA